MAYDSGSGRLGGNTRSQYLERNEALKSERSSFYPHWQDLSRFILPRAGRFFLSDRNRGERRDNNIYDSTGTRASRVLAAGMMAGMTSPARPWFRLATHDPDLMEHGPVKLWLDLVTKLMRDIFSRSNTYRALHSLYEELGVFGTAANVILPNFDTVIHHEPLTTGEYCIGYGPDGKINVLYREFEMTVNAMIETFGRKSCSMSVRNLYDRDCGYNSWVPVIHVIEPRPMSQRDTRLLDGKNMAYKSCYFETGGNEDMLLREGGYKRFIATTPRWHTSGGDIYATSCPGMEALGDIKQLQHQQMRKSQAIDYMVKPPLQMPTMLKEQPLATMPGGVAFVDQTGAGNSIKSMFDVRLDLSHLGADIADVRQRINSAFYVDLFLFMQQLDASQSRTQITAREIAERHEEKLIMLGPVLERLHDELLKPMIDVTFDYCVEAGILPPPPPELADNDLNVEFVSMLAQAQRAVGIGSVDRLIGTALALTQLQAAAQQVPTVVDKIDSDQIIDKVGDMLGVDPDLIVSDDKVLEVREQRAAAERAKAQAAQAQQMAETASTLASAKTDEPSALTALTGGYSGPDTGL